MVHVSDTALNEMLRMLPKDQRKTLSHIISGKVTYQVRCNGDCKGEVIAYVYDDGIDPLTRQPQSRIEPTVIDGTMKLRASRKRLDGEIGFQCWCGNDSRISSHESGDIKPNGLPPTRDGLVAIYGRLQTNPTTYTEVDGVKEVDGFSFERVAA